MGSGQSQQTDLLDEVQLDPPYFDERNDLYGIIPGYKKQVRALINKNRQWYEYNHKKIMDQFSSLMSQEHHRKIKELDEKHAAELKKAKKFCALIKLSSKKLHSYQEQGDELDVTFKCADGEQKCEKVYLTESDFFCEKVDAFDKLKNDYEFDYTNFSKQAIKVFIDLLHHIDIEIERLELNVILEILFFLHCEGKTAISDFESKLADYLYDDLIARDMNDNTTLMVVCFLASLDNYNTRFEDEKAVKLEKESIKDINMNFDPKSSQYLSIVQLMRKQFDRQICEDDSDAQIEFDFHRTCKRLLKKIET